MGQAHEQVAVIQQPAQDSGDVTGDVASMGPRTKSPWKHAAVPGHPPTNGCSVRILYGGYDCRIVTAKLRGVKHC